MQSTARSSLVRRWPCVCMRRVRQSCLSTMHAASLPISMRAGTECTECTAQECIACSQNYKPTASGDACELDCSTAIPVSRWLSG